MEDIWYSTYMYMYMYGTVHTCTCTVWYSTYMYMYSMVQYIHVHVQYGTVHTCTVWYSTYMYMYMYHVHVWVTRKFPFSVNNDRATEIVFRFCARSVLHNSVFIFAAWAKLFYACAAVKTYVRKAGARKLLIYKELPISKNGDGV